jgi:hypothetical protein
MIYNYYVYTNNIEGDNRYYDYTFTIGDNITIQKDEIIKFKLINFSIMNAMLNVSSYHGNNSFQIIDAGNPLTINIPDGNYTAISLRDKINSICVDNYYPLAFNYDKTINKYWITTADNILAGEFYFYPNNCASLLGYTQPSYDLPTGEYYADTFANMLSYSKICLTSSSLAFNNTTDNNLEVKYKNNMGINEMICWVNRDVPPFTTINYTNLENVEYELGTTNLKSINFKIMNEYKQLIVDAPPSFIQFQLIIDKKIDWFQKFYKLINDIYYTLLSLYFK